MPRRSTNVARRLSKAIKNDVFTVDGQIASADVSTNQYDSLAALPLTGIAAGTKAFVEDSDRLYISNGTGWYSIALTNASPSINSAGDTTYTMSYGSPITISINAVDSDQTPLTYGFSETGLGSLATVSNDSSEFTITPTSNYALEGSFNLTFTASDGINTATSSSSAFTLVNQAPSLSGTGSTYALASDGTTTTSVTLTGSDPEGQALTWSASGDAGFNYIATVSNINNVFTITPKNSTNAPGGGSGSLTFSVSDGVKSTTGSSSFTLAFLADWSSNTLDITTNTPTGNETFALGSFFSIDNEGEKIAASIPGNSVDFNGNYFGGSYTGKAGTLWFYNRSGSTISTQTNGYFSNDVANDQYGKANAVSGDGNWAAVTARNEVDVDFYQWSNGSWSLQQSLNISNSAGTFGRCIVLDEDASVGLVSERAGTNKRGAVWILRRSSNTWSYESTNITSNSSSNNFSFGCTSARFVYPGMEPNLTDIKSEVEGENCMAISRDGNYAVIGEFRTNSGVAGNGGIHIVSLGSSTGYTHLQRIDSPSSRAYSHFGGSVAISNDGTWIVTSEAGWDSMSGNDSGHVYIYKKGSGNSWSLADTLTKSAGYFDGFGQSLDLDGDGNTLAIGAADYDNGSNNSEGKVYIYSRDNSAGSSWTEESTITSPSPSNFGFFGYALKLTKDGTRLFVGQPLSAGPSGYTHGGAFYVYQSN